MECHKWKQFTTFLVLLASLAGCQAKQSVLLENTLCQYPCWQKIRPGITSSEDALEILQRSPFLDSPPSSAPRKIDDVRSASSWVFAKNILEVSGGITYFNDTVAYIEFDVIGNISIHEMIKYYGKPEFISVITGREDSRWLRVCWIYPDAGVLITHFDHRWQPSGGFARITPDLPVYRVYYFDPDLYDILAKTVFFQLARQKVVKESIQPWVDYGLVPFVEE
jgi:hypothetical protein